MCVYGRLASPESQAEEVEDTDGALCGLDDDAESLSHEPGHWVHDVLHAVQGRGGCWGQHKSAGDSRSQHKSAGVSTSQQGTARSQQRSARVSRESHSRRTRRQGGQRRDRGIVKL